MPNYKLAAERAAKKYGIDKRVFLNQINAESGFNPNAGSPAGAKGIAQFMPATAKQYHVNLGDGRVTDDLEGAARYMRDALKQTGGDYKKALSIYNSGRANGYLSIPETKAYVAKIMGGKDIKVGSGKTTVTVPGKTTTPADDSAVTNEIVSQLLSGKKLDLTKAASQPVVPAKTSTTPSKTVTKDATTDATVKTPKGVGHFEGTAVAAWIAPILEYARERGWKGSVTSGYRSFAEQKAIYDRGTRPAAKPGTSNHEFTAFPGGAVDVSNAEQLSQILQGSKYAHMLVWAGSKDPVHFSHPHNGSY